VPGKGLVVRPGLAIQGRIHESIDLLRDHRLFS
jgi:hypothetical protein